MNRSIRYWSGGRGLTQIAIWTLLCMEGFWPRVWLGRSGEVCPPCALSRQRILWVAEGLLIVRLPDRDQNFILRQGDRLEIPAHVSHETIIESSRLVCVEARGSYARQRL